MKPLESEAAIQAFAAIVFYISPLKALVYIYLKKKKGLVLEGNFSFCFLCFFSNGAEVMLAHGSSKLQRFTAVLRAHAAPAHPMLRDPMSTPVQHKKLLNLILPPWGKEGRAGLVSRSLVHSSLWVQGRGRIAPGGFILIKKGLGSSAVC